MIRYSFAFLLLLLVPACSQAASDAGSGTAQQVANTQQVHPDSGLAVIPLTITHDGKRHAFAVEVALSRLEQSKGLMFRSEMGADEGMLFPMDPPRVASFWMKNTVIPLDMVFIGTDHRILNIEAETVPYSEQPHFAAGLAIAVLELNGGRAAELGIGPGDLVDW